jgi:hypothetical protein
LANQAFLSCGTARNKAQQLKARQAEFIACAGALFGETLNLHSLIEALVEIRVPIIFKRDNQTTITVIRSGYSAKLRSANRVHRVNLASVHEQLEGGVFDMEYCNTELQLANALTKVVALQHWSEALAQLCVQL